MILGFFSSPLTSWLQSLCTWCENNFTKAIWPCLIWPAFLGASMSAGLSSWLIQPICCKSLKIYCQMPAVKSPCTCPNVTCGYLTLSTAPGFLWLSQLPPLACDGDNLFLSLIQSIPASGQQMAYDIGYCFLRVLYAQTEKWKGLNYKALVSFFSLSSTKKSIGFLFARRIAVLLRSITSWPHKWEEKILCEMKGK